MLYSRNGEARTSRRFLRPSVLGLERREVLSVAVPQPLEPPVLPVEAAPELPVDQAAELMATSGLSANQAPISSANGPRIQRVSLQPRLGRVYVQFLNGASGVDPASLPGNIRLSKLSNLRRGQTADFVGTPTGYTFTFSPVVAGETNQRQTIAASFDFGRPLRAGSYFLELNSGPDGIRDTQGRPLDGEFQGTFPSGNSVPGGNFRATLPTFNKTYVYLPKPIGGFFAPGNRAPLPLGNGTVRIFTRWYGP